MDKKEILALIEKNFLVPQLVEGMLAGPVDKALQKLVDDTSNPFDNMLKAAAYPVVMAELNKAVQENWAKLFAPEA